MYDRERESGKRTGQLIHEERKYRNMESITAQECFDTWETHKKEIQKLMSLDTKPSLNPG